MVPLLGNIISAVAGQIIQQNLDSDSSYVKSSVSNAAANSIKKLIK